MTLYALSQKLGNLLSGSHSLRSTQNVGLIGVGVPSKKLQDALAVLILLLTNAFSINPLHAQGMGMGNESPSSMIVSITVESGASKLNMRQSWPARGIQNWGCVKAPGKFVLVRVRTNPNNKATWDKINWSGGSSSTGRENNYRLYPRDNAEKLVVKPLLNGRGLTQLQIWVMWAKVVIATSGPRPTNAPAFPAPLQQNLGAIGYNDSETGPGDKRARGHICAVCTLEPAGVHNVAGRGSLGWSIRRQRFSHDYKDLAVSLPAFTYTWIDDTSAWEYVNLVPDNMDKIYDIDAPNVPHLGSRYVTYNNFRQWVTWNNQVASTQFSETGKWYWQAKWDSSLTPQVFNKHLSPIDSDPTNQLIPLPTTP